MKTKNCIHCKLDKEFSEFHKSAKHKDGLVGLCKLCKKIKDKEIYAKNRENKLLCVDNYRKNNPELIKKYKANYYIKNKNKLLAKQKEYGANNKEKIKIKNKEYQKNNKLKANLKQKLRLKNNKKYRLNHYMSTATYDCLKKEKNCRSWKLLVDYTTEELKVHLESKFTKGMTWENYGKNGWHIDHIIPKSLFKFDSYNHPAFKACWALENLQPLWATTEIAVSYGEGLDYVGNNEKGNRIKITEEIQILLDSVNISN